jgi:WD40 repeat protein
MREGFAAWSFSTEDSQTLATGAFDGRMKLWDIETGVETGGVEGDEC